MGSNAPGKQLLFSFGVAADVQYADIPDGYSFYGIPRYYRHSLQVLERAVERWNRLENLKFVINLGDIVDGKCPKDQSISSVKRVADTFNRFNGPVYHLIGNHCLYNVPREELLSLLDIHSSDGQGYYEISPVPNFRVIVLDGYDISAMGWPKNHPKTLMALKFLDMRNPNPNKNSPNGLHNLDRRFVMYNGAVSKEQLQWLDCALRDATELKQKVLICCHQPLDPGAANIDALLWNYDEVMKIVHHYNCVKVCLAGHDHGGGYSVDSHGIHHRSLEAILECPPGSDAFGYIDVYDDRMILFGTDRMQSTEMPFK